MQTGVCFTPRSVALATVYYIDRNRVFLAVSPPTSAHTYATSFLRRLGFWRSAEIPFCRTSLEDPDGDAYIVTQATFDISLTRILWWAKLASP